jgi:small subunit ribosomal protein S4
VNGRKVRIPSYLVKKEEEESISYSPSSPLKEEEHPSRPTIEVKNE